MLLTQKVDVKLHSIELEICTYGYTTSIQFFEKKKSRNPPIHYTYCHRLKMNPCALEKTRISEPSYCLLRSEYDRKH